MKITLDIDKLLETGEISEEEYKKLKSLSQQTTTSLGLNILVGTGIIAVVGGTLALLQSAPATILLGFILCAGGGKLKLSEDGPLAHWKLLGNILLQLGTLLTGGGIIAATNGTTNGLALISLLAFIGGFITQSGLLIGLSAFCLAGTLGSATRYFSGMYMLHMQSPAITAAVFSILSYWAYLASKSLLPTPANLLRIFSRCSFIIANIGFWVGSIDLPFPELNTGPSPLVFASLWAVGLAATGIWATKNGIRWMVNTTATFGMIHLYTQWFTHLHATPASVIGAGILAIGIGYGLIKYNLNHKMQRTQK
jgi:hypothetical protein